MKNKKTIITLIVLGIISLSTLGVLALDTDVLNPLSEEEIADLQFNREEEKLARDVYLTLFAEWNLSVFENIARSEQVHIDAIGDLITQYNLDDPLVDDTIGSYDDPILLTLYSDLVAQGRTSIIEALKVGAFIEEMDIKDLQDFISRSDHDDLIATYNQLMRGSRNHMRSFMKSLESYGGSYTPTILPQAEFDAIVSTLSEKGNN